MPTTGWAAIPTPTNASPVNIPADMLAMATPLDKKVVPAFANTGTRDAAATAAGGASVGMLCTVAGVLMERLTSGWLAIDGYKGAFVDAVARDAVLTAPQAGWLANLTSTKILMLYDGTTWQILHEPPTTWTVTSINQGGARACTTTYGWYQRSFGVWRAHLSLTGFAAGTSGQQIKVAPPFTIPSPHAVGGAWHYLRAGVANYVGVVVADVATELLLIPDDQPSTLGASPAFGTASNHVLKMDLQGRY